MLATRGKFSDDSSYYLVNNRTKYVINTETGKIVTSFELHDKAAAVSNKSANILVLMTSSKLMVINIDTKELLFAKQFEYADPIYFEVSGDGSKVRLTRKNTYYEYRIKSLSQE